MSTVSFQNGKYITTAEAAVIIGCTPRHVRHLLFKAKKIKGEKFGPTAIIIERASAIKYAKTEQPRGRPRLREPQIEE